MIKKGDIVNILESGADYTVSFFINVESIKQKRNRINIVGSGIMVWLSEGTPAQIEINPYTEVDVPSYEYIKKINTLAYIKKAVIADIFRYYPTLLVFSRPS